jgi:hypothetical protein
VDEGGAGGTVLKCQDGVIVRGTMELNATLGEAPDVVVQAFAQLVLAVAQLPLLARAGVRALEVADKGSAQVCPFFDLSTEQVLKPGPREVTKVER